MSGTPTGLCGFDSRTGRMVDATTDNSGVEQEVPDDYEPYYPPSPEIQGVEISGREISNPREIKISVEYWTHRNHGHSNEAEVVFRIQSSGVAELRDVSGSFKLVDQLSAIATATDHVTEHASVDEVKGLEDTLDDAREYIKNCVDHEESEE